MRRSLCLMISLVMGSLSCSPADSSPASLKTNVRRTSRLAQFCDDAKTNTKVDSATVDLSFIDRKGNRVDLKEFRGKKNIVLVVTRGYSGHLCPYCTAQTAQLIAQYGEFAKRGAEVLLVFPGPKDNLEKFILGAEESADNESTPFPVLLDENFAAVDKLGIRGELAKPSTDIIDKQGRIRFAYVGATISDRPSVKAMLTQLDETKTKR